MQSANNFGILSSEYRSARRGYPSEVYEYLLSLIKKEHPMTLDLGCGTGIATRELKEHGFIVTGADKDAQMIAAAKVDDSAISYVVAPAHALPFPDAQFDVVTAFTAFHWFNTPEALNEIKRVLKPEGLFFAALKGNQSTDEAEKFNKGYQAVLKKYAGASFDSTYKHFEREHGEEVFGTVTEKSFPVDEKYSVEDALVLLRSLSLWNLVPEEKRQDLLDEMQQFYESQLIDGCVIRKREIFTIAARKK